MLILLLAILVIGPFTPNPALTPGAVVPMTVQTLCGTKWGKDRRHVTLAMRHQVFAAYGIPYAKHALYELDHLVPRELGGADAVANLWPEVWSDAHLKDHEENRLHRAVCAGAISLTDAQTQMKRWGR
jgi:hypothetical protein